MTEAEELDAAVRPPTPSSFDRDRQCVDRSRAFPRLTASNHPFEGIFIAGGDANTLNICGLGAGPSSPPVLPNFHDQLCVPTRPSASSTASYDGWMQIDNADRHLHDGSPAPPYSYFTKRRHGEPKLVGGAMREFQWTPASGLDVRLVSTGEGFCYLTMVRGYGTASIHVDTAGVQWLRGEYAEEARARCLSRIQ